ncbi:MAG: LysE family translocator, partial [Oceanospirillum sp.]|nr:LysE family translocator [Oceanospirillum sp.]
NPKAWVMTLSMVSAFSVAGEYSWQSIGMIILVAFMVMNLTQNAWAGFGMAIGRLLTSDKIRLRFNIMMATLTALSVYFVLR